MPVSVFTVNKELSLQKLKMFVAFHRRSLDKVGPGMCTPPPRSRAILALGLGVCCMGLVNASLGFMMLGERGVENRERMRALLKPKPQ
jgi:hypothetical protein